MNRENDILTIVPFYGNTDDTIHPEKIPKNVFEDSE